jgi:hypothetical protein
MSQSSQLVSEKGEVCAARRDFLSVRFARSWKPVFPLGNAARNLSALCVNWF